MQERKLLAVLALAVLTFGAATIYSLERGRSGPPDVHAGMSVPGTGGLADTDTMVARLRMRLLADPNDADGWRMLGWSEAQFGNPAAAVEAYEHVVDLRPEDIGGWSALAQANLAAGSVSKARRAADKALALDRSDPQAVFGHALVIEAEGHAAQAKTLLEGLLNGAPRDADYRAAVQDEIDRIASSRARPSDLRMSTPQEGMAPPIASEAAAALQSMPADQQQSAIEGMVEKLEARLERQPGDLEGWQRLMRSRMVLGQPEQAAKAFRHGLDAFAGDERARSELRRSAQELGVTG